MGRFYKIVNHKCFANSRSILIINFRLDSLAPHSPFRSPASRGFDMESSLSHRFTKRQCPNLATSRSALEENSVAIWRIEDIEVPFFRIRILSRTSKYGCLYYQRRSKKTKKGHVDLICSCVCRTMSNLACRRLRLKSRAFLLSQKIFSVNILNRNFIDIRSAFAHLRLHRQNEIH